MSLRIDLGHGIFEVIATGLCAGGLTYVTDDGRRVFVHWSAVR